MNRSLKKIADFGGGGYRRISQALFAPGGSWSASVKAAYTLVPGGVSLSWKGIVKTFFRENHPTLTLRIVH